MKKHYFLGLAAGRKGALRQLFVHGSKQDAAKLSGFLARKYNGEVILTKNGRSALTLTLKAYFNKGDKVLVNGFTCYAVYEAVRAAGCVPVFVDISKKDLNAAMRSDVFRHAPSRPSLRGSGAQSAPVVADGLKTSNLHSPIRGIIVQNTLGNPVDMAAVEKFAIKNHLMIIEDLAHSVGVKYADGREAGTVGAATVLSFGKEKAVDATSGGAAILRAPYEHKISAPNKRPKLADYLRERWYPTFAAIARGLSYVHLSGAWMRGLVKIHWVEKSADNRLDLTRKMPNFEAKLALEQLKKLKNAGPLREFYLVRDREKVLARLRKNGYYFDGLWYEKPVSPVRYYKKVHFPEADCPVATEVAAKIVNLPKYYTKGELEKARKIIEEYEDA